MDPLVQLQQDITDALNGDQLFATIPVASYTKMVISQEVEKRAPHLMLKGGKTGCGVMVNMPDVFGESSNISTPQSEAVCTFDVVEIPEINFFASNGSLTYCETVARAIRAIIEPLAIYGLMGAGASVFYAKEDEAVISPIVDIEKIYPGCRAYRVTLRIKFSEPFLPKVMLPASTWAGDTLTLINQTAGATIYYTTDGTFPGPGNYGTKQDGTAGTSVVYAAPVAIASGKTVRFAASLANYTASDAGQIIAP
jgi:hypothetical protein